MQIRFLMIKFFSCNCLWISCSWCRSICQFLLLLLCSIIDWLIRLGLDFHKFRSFKNLLEFLSGFLRVSESKYFYLPLKNLWLLRPKHLKYIQQWPKEELFLNEWASSWLFRVVWVWWKAWAVCKVHYFLYLSQIYRHIRFDCIFE